MKKMYEIKYNKITNKTYIIVTSNLIFSVFKQQPKNLYKKLREKKNYERV